MTVKVVQGLIGDLKPNQQAKVTTQSSITAAQSAAATSPSFQQASTEAVNISVRNLRASSTSEKIRDSKEAREIADQVADKIKTESDSLGAHEGLSSSRSTQHLAQQ